VAELDPAPCVTQPIALAAALLAAVVLWLSRDLIGVEFGVRLVLPVLWLAVWTSACLGVGWWSLRLLAGPGDRPTLVEVLAAGAAVLALTSALAATVGAFRPWLLQVVLAIAAIEGVRQLWRPRVRPSLPPIAVATASAILLAAAGATLLALVTAPPVMFDALNYHLAFPARWLAAGGFVEFPRHFFSYYPSAHGLLYSFALATVGPWGANAVHWWFGALAVLAAAELGGHLGGRRAATWAAACFGLTPAVLEIGGHAIADLAVAAFAGAALVALTRPESTAWTWRTAATAGLLAGTAAATKYLALATVVLPVALALVVLAPRRRPAACAAFAVGAAIALAPWLGRNLLWTGNPVYPYLQTVLGGPPCERDLSAELASTTQSPGAFRSALPRALTAPVVRTFTPLREGGLIGAHWLILVPVAAAVRGLPRRRTAALWLAAAAAALAWGSLDHYARFLLPAMVPAAALAGAAAAALTASASRTVARLFTVLLTGVLAWNATVIASTFNLDQLSTVAGHLSQRDFVNRWVSYGPAIPAVEEAVPDDGVILLVAEPRNLYVNREVLVEDPYRTPLLIELARGCHDSSELARRVSSLGATHVLVNSSEMDFFAGLRSNDNYWSDATASERRLIEELLSGHLRPLFRTDHLLLGELVSGAGR
jgi:4-amino-4-deoxy-L-arabinose transferase-like glycosyltransferase